MIIDKYFSLVIQEKLFGSEGNLNFYLDYLYKDIDFNNKRVLDIGGGSGLLSTFYAASMGASEVVCLEPEIGGTQINATEKFKEVRAVLGVSDKVKLEVTTIQDFDPKDKKFDVIISHNSINHLDEAACINLRHDSSAQEKYRAISMKLFNILNDDAQLVIADCSRYNFFGLCHIKNPFSPYIEWHKHQSPYLWASLLGGVGFSKQNIRWWSFNSLRSFGRLVLGNPVAAYFVYSHFCLILKKDPAKTTV